MQRSHETDHESGTTGKVLPDRRAGPGENGLNILHHLVAPVLNVLFLFSVNALFSHCRAMCKELFENKTELFASSAGTFR
jgi:hypothetical protein